MQSIFFESKMTVDVEGNRGYDRPLRAVDYREMNKALFTNGVYIDPSDTFKVYGGDGLVVKINPGKCWIEGAFGYEPDTRELLLDSADSAHDRIDIVVLRLDDTQNYRNIDLYRITGTPASNPVPPLPTRNQTVYELVLAEIYIPANNNSVSDARISDRRSDSDLCGYVKGVIDEIDVTDLFKQFEVAFEESINSSELNFDTWFDGIKEYYDSWFIDATTDFDTWFESIKGKLSTDIAGSLQLQVDEVNERIAYDSEHVRGTYVTSDSVAHKTSPRIEGQTLNNLARLDLPASELFNAIYSGVIPKVEGGIVTITSTVPNVIARYIYGHEKIKPNTKYTVVFDVLENTLDSTFDAIGQSSVTKLSKSYKYQAGEVGRAIVYLTSVADTSDKVVTLTTTNNGIGTVRYKFMIFEGAIDESLIPYQVDGMESVTGELVVASGKDYSDAPIIKNEYVIGSTGAIANSATWNLIDNIVCNGAITVEFSGSEFSSTAGMSLFDTDGNFVKGVTYDGNSKYTILGTGIVKISIRGVVPKIYNADDSITYQADLRSTVDGTIRDYIENGYLHQLVDENSEPLAEPIITDLNTPKTWLETFDGQTNVFIEGSNVQPIIDTNIPTQINYGLKKELDKIYRNEEEIESVKVEVEEQVSTALNTLGNRLTIVEGRTEQEVFDITELNLELTPLTTSTVLGSLYKFGNLARLHLNFITFDIPLGGYVHHILTIDAKGVKNGVYFGKAVSATGYTPEDMYLTNTTQNVIIFVADGKMKVYLQTNVSGYNVYYDATLVLPVEI